MMKIKTPVVTPEKTLFFLTVFLSIVGLLFVFEASVSEAFTQFGNQFYYARQQAIWLGIGLISIFAGIAIPTEWWKKCAPFLYVLGIVLLFFVFIPGLGRGVNGAHRWIGLFGFTLQPVELVKFGIITFFAAWMEKHQKIPPFLFLTFLPTALLLIQPDLGSALIVLAIAFGLFFLAGAPAKLFLGIGGIGIVALIIIIILSPYRLKRVTTFLNPDSDPLGASFHIHQITLALGNGGVIGQGIGRSKQKYSYLPEASTDSIFAIIAEEIGFVGCLFLLLLFFLYIQLSYKIIIKTIPKSFEHLLATGIILWIGMQILLNISAIVALVPLTGIPLPFFSYGGSSLVMVLFVTGILIGIGRREHSVSDIAVPHRMRKQ